MVTPLVLFAIAYIAGIVVAGALKTASALPAACALVGVIAYLLVFRRTTCFRVTASVALFFLAGILLASLAAERLDAGLLNRAARASEYAVAEGALVSDATYRRGVARFDMRVSRFTVEGKTWRVREYLRVNVCADGPLKLRATDGVRVAGRMELPDTGDDFDYRGYLYHRGIVAVLDADPQDIERISEDVPMPLSVAASLRDWIRQRNRAHLAADCAGLLNGIVLGDTSLIDEKVDEAFRETGLTHIVAASGMNIAVIVGALWPLLRLLRLRAAAQWAALIAFAGMYTLVSGMSPSITRAFLMAAVGLSAWLIGRQKNALGALAAAALIILTVDPFVLYDTGFQLSFAATAALVMLVPLFERWMEGTPRPLRTGLSVTLAAQMGVLPIMIYYFGYISSISLVANLIVAPLAAPVLILGMAALPIEALSPVLSAPVYVVLDVALKTIIYTAKALASMPGSALYFRQPGIGPVIVLYLVLLATILLLKNVKLKLRLGHVILLLVTVSMLAVWWQAGRALAPGQLEIVFLDVGQGDAALITAPDGARVLIDTGPSPRTIKRALDERGVSKLDAVVLSHAHADHSNGTESLLSEFAVGTLVYAQGFDESSEGRDILTRAKEQSIRRILTARGDTLHISRHLNMEVLAAGAAAGDTNDESAVLMVKYGELAVLFTGDAGADVEETLVDDSAGIDADVLKVGHHGSSASSSRAFLREVTPAVSVISVGNDNMYGHPSRAAIARLKGTGSKIYRTDMHGDVTIRSDGETYRVFTEKRP